MDTRIAQEDGSTEAGGGLRVSGGHPQGTCVSDTAGEHLQEQVYVRTGSFQAKLRQQESGTLSLGCVGDAQCAWRDLRAGRLGVRRGAGLRSGSAFAVSLEACLLLLHC